MRSILVACIVASPCLAQGNAPSRDDALAAIESACAFFANDVAATGPYCWRVTGDLKLREGEGRCDATLGWVQPPGLPTVGGAFLDVYDLTGDARYLAVAQGVGQTLVKGQLHTGGWYYHLETDPVKRQEYLYRDMPVKKVGRSFRTTSLDDNVTQSTARFLMRLDKTLGFRDASVHDAAEFCLETLLIAQRPIGAWYQNWREYPKPTTDAEFPVIAASYPADWSREWLNDWPGQYYLNDNVLMDMVDVMLDAYDTYGDERFHQSALRAGDFFIMAQMPDPQPAWAQQYDIDMHPCWDRKFEPPAISGRESQDAMLCLIKLYRRSSDARYLEPIPRAIEYLRSSILPDGRLARFYELRTNSPLYFTKDYQLTYDSSDMPKHYRFAWDSDLDAIEAAYNLAKAGEPEPVLALTPELSARVAAMIRALDDRGAWVEEGVMDTYDMEPESGIISSQTFADNIRALCDYAALTAE